MNLIQILLDRAEMLATARSFFNKRQIIEVDTPLLTTYASIDEHIDLIKTTCNRYLHSSPEYAMKRLLAEGMKDIFSLSHVFRKEEIGNRHNPEFMMAEWYRLGFSFEQMIQETTDFIRLFVGNIPSKQKSYRETFEHFTGLDITKTTIQDLIDYACNQNISLYEGIENEGIDALLNIILGSHIEPQLGIEELFILTHYPASQSALARKVNLNGYLACERFEIYFKGLELANGYHELTEATEQRMRLVEANVKRRASQKEELPMDEYFLNALIKGLPDCCGVAVGFDRLMMLRHKTKNIGEVIPFSWNNI